MIQHAQVKTKVKTGLLTSQVMIQHAQVKTKVGTGLLTPQVMIQHAQVKTKVKTVFLTHQHVLSFDQHPSLPLDVERMIRQNEPSVWMIIIPKLPGLSTGHSTPGLGLL